ncbi:MAG: mannanase [Stygiobacter sp.]|nr:MAG: mannanase [Stygiobacter sp.]KAF0214329.1 MAG: hypothetical protein FD178_2504 [Ignavibacteria bacterium]
MKRIILIVTLLSTFYLQGCSAMNITESKFIRVRGTQFELDGKPYYFVGTNLWYGCYLGASDEFGDRERLIRELDNLQAIGVTNLRILAGSETSYIKKSLQPTIQIEPGVYNDQLLEGLDFLLAEMRKRNMHAVVLLNNYWEWSGGFAAYNNWTNFGEAIDPYVQTNRWGDFMNYTASFYSNEKGNELFRNFILKIITRQNKFTGDYYSEDPTIMAWQLANEPRPGQAGSLANNINAFCNWIDQTAQYIKSIDPNHLVTTGSEGVIGSLQRDSVYIKAHESKFIDYATFHVWAKNWEWYDSKQPEATFPTAEANALDYFNTHMKFARFLNKPVTMEEFGLGRNLESCDPNSSTEYRDKYYKIMLNVVHDSAFAGAPIAGANFWAWGGEGRGKNQDNVWRKGDPFVGDPPHEPQGLNTVFNSDQSTIDILKRHSEQMNALRDREFSIAKPESSNTK